MPEKLTPWSSVVDTFDGTVSLAQAGRELIGFCKEWFLEMEDDSLLPEEMMGDEVGEAAVAG